MSLIQNKELLVRKIAQVKFTSLYILLFILLQSCSNVPSVSGQTEPSLSKKDTSEVRFVNSRKFFIYKVGKNETMYSISKKFGIPQEEIRQFNPDLDKTGLAAKMKLWIPAYSWLNKTEDNKPTVVAEDPNAGNKMYSIALFTSLKLTRIYLPETPPDSLYINEPLENDIIQNLQFIEGALKAVDDMHLKGFKVHLTIYDTEEDQQKVLKILTNPSLKTQNLLLTNEGGLVLARLNEYSKSHDVRLLACAGNSADIIKLNPNAINISAASRNQCKAMGKESVAIHRNSSCVILRTGINKETDRGDAFREGWKAADESRVIKEVNYDKLSSQPLIDSLIKNRNNIIFIPTSNEEMVSTMLNALKEVLSDYQITVIGLPTWQYFETIDPALLELCSVRIFNTGYIDYNKPGTETFRNYFRTQYNTEPGESAFQGYDGILIAANQFMKCGNKFYDENKEVVTNGLFSSYQFTKMENGQCLENKVIHIMRFEDYLLVCVPESK